VISNMHSYLTKELENNFKGLNACFTQFFLPSNIFTCCNNHHVLVAVMIYP